MKCSYSYALLRRKRQDENERVRCFHFPVKNIISPQSTHFAFFDDHSRLNFVNRWIYFNDKRQLQKLQSASKCPESQLPAIDGEELSKVTKVEHRNNHNTLLCGVTNQGFQSGEILNNCSNGIKCSWRNGRKVHHPSNRPRNTRGSPAGLPCLNSSPSWGRSLRWDGPEVDCKKSMVRTYFARDSSPDLNSFLKPLQTRTFKSAKKGLTGFITIRMASLCKTGGRHSDVHVSLTPYWAPLGFQFTPFCNGSLAAGQPVGKIMYGMKNLPTSEVRNPGSTDCS